MSRKTSPARSARAATPKSAASTAVRRTTRKNTKAQAATPASSRSSKSPAAKSDQRDLSPVEVLTRAESDVAAAIETLNQHMNAALATFTELASAHHGRGKAVIRTAPLDRATATFQRLIAEVVDEQLAELLPPLIDVRNRLAQRAANAGPDGESDTELLRNAAQVLDHVLTTAGTQVFEARPGETYDPLIHLAVGETTHPHLPDGAVGEVLLPGYRSARGKVLAPAKVKVNRR